MSVSLTYFQLSSEDYRWWWRSLLSVGSISVYVFGYAVYFFTTKSNMSGPLQVWYAYA